MHPLFARQLGKIICYEKYLYLDVPKLKFWFNRVRSLQALFQIFEGHPNETKVVCTWFYQFFRGPDPDKTCILPFTYRGVTYNSCTMIDDDAVGLFVSNIWNGINPHIFRPGVQLLVSGVTVGLAVLQRLMSMSVSVLTAWHITMMTLTLPSNI